MLLICVDRFLQIGDQCVLHVRTLFIDGKC